MSEWAKEFKQRLKSQGNAELQRRIVEFAMWPICCTFIEVGLQVGNWMLARELNAGRITVAEFVSLGEMLYHIVFMTRHLMEKIPEMFAIQEPLNRIFTVMETVSNVEPMAGNAPKPKMTEVKFTGNFNEAGEPEFEPLVKGEKPVIDITFENVNFSYPNNPERQILDTLSLRAVGGKSTAFVGKSGCGKTTTIQLIKRFFDPEIGKVIVNGLPLATWDVRDYRSLMATVAQGVQLKEGTIRENLMYGMSESQQVEFESQGMAEADKILQKYCELACCWDNCIKELPLQFETRLGESEGCADGCSVGTALGWNVGVADGSSDGSAEGSRLGSAEGSAAAKEEENGGRRGGRERSMRQAADRLANLYFASFVGAYLVLAEIATAQSL